MKEIEGVENITSDENIMIVKLISEVNTNRSKPPSHPSTIKYHKLILMHGTSKSRKSRLKQYNVPSIKIMFTNSDFARHLYNKARNKLTSMLRRDKSLFEKRIATESKSLLVPHSEKTKNEKWGGTLI